MATFGLFWTFLVGFVISRQFFMFTTFRVFLHTWMSIFSISVSHLEALSDFRENVRQAAIKKELGQVLQNCDKIRDDTENYIIDIDLQHFFSDLVAFAIFTF